MLFLLVKPVYEAGNLFPNHTFIKYLSRVSQSTAEIKLLMVYENKRPPYWNSISGFDFDVCVVIGVSFYIVETGRSVSES